MICLYFSFVVTIKQYHKLYMNNYTRFCAYLQCPDVGKRGLNNISTIPNVRLQLNSCQSADSS
jgi:hypothetical protein